MVPVGGVKQSESLNNGEAILDRGHLVRREGPNWGARRLRGSPRGRSELQFNIGVEAGPHGNEIRHGVAFSFELSQSVPNIDALVPKARLFSEYLQLYPEQCADMRM